MKKITLYLLAMMMPFLFFSGCTQEKPLGSDRDAYGCIPSAGYAWCNVTQMCYRSFEENCTAIAAVPMKDRHGCVQSEGYAWCESEKKCLSMTYENCSSISPLQPTNNTTAPSNQTEQQSAIENNTQSIMPNASSTPNVSNVNIRLAPTCNQESYTMALIFVAKDVNDPNISRYMEELMYVKNRLPWAFNFATGGRATMTVPGRPIIMDSKGIVSSGNFSLSTVLDKFYEESADDYDFVSVFTNIEDPSTNYYHEDVQNNIIGIGKPIFNNSEIYGSKGRLKGVNYMNNMLDKNGDVRDCYKEQGNNFTALTVASNCGMGGILHETAHQWAVYVGDIVPGTEVGVTGSKPDKPLSIRGDFAHYYFGFDAPEGTNDLLGSDHWEKAADDNFFVYNDLDESVLLKYHPFTLYFMGLLPEREYDTKFNIYQDIGTYVIHPNEVGTYMHDPNYSVPYILTLNPNIPLQSMKSVYNQVSVRDVIAREGSRGCIANVAGQDQNNNQ